MRCKKNYVGEACNTCIQCGKPMSAGETVCANCGADEKILISSPFLKCPRCMQKQWSFNFSVDALAILIIAGGMLSLLVGIIGKIFFKNPALDVYFVRAIIAGIATFGAALIYSIACSIKPNRIWWLIWQPFLGILLSSLGIFIFSKAMFFMGGILAITWFFSQRCHLKVFELSAKKNAVAIQRDAFEAKMNSNIPEDVKKLNKMNREEGILVWKLHKLFSIRWLFRFLGFTAILVVIVFAGPGEYLYRDSTISGIKSVGTKVRNAFDFSSNIQPEVEQAVMDFLVKKFELNCFSQEQIDSIFSLGDVTLIKEVYDTEVRERLITGSTYDVLKKDLSAYKLLAPKGLTVKQFFQLRPLLVTDQIFILLTGYSPDKLVKDASNAGLQGKELFDKLESNLKIPETPVYKFALLTPVLKYFQSIRCAVWFWSIGLLVIFCLLDFVFIVFIAFSAICLINLILHKKFVKMQKFISWQKFIPLANGTFLILSSYIFRSRI